MSDTWRQMKAYVRFTEEDARQVRRLAPIVLPHVDAIVDDFYERLAEQPGTDAVLRSEPGRSERLRISLRRWLERLFCGRYDEAYFEERLRVGRAHVRVGLAQHWMFGAMDTIRQRTEACVRAARKRGAEPRLEALRKLIAVELAVMLESYKETYSDRVREVERNTVQERLTQAQHLAKIGSLAATLAHEIKNPLAGISGAIQVIRDGMEPSAPHRRILGEVLRQIDRLDGTVKDLLVYARPLPPRFEVCDLRRVVESCVMLLSREPELGGLLFERDIEAVVPDIEADERQLEQLLMNLLLNAGQASGAGQRVRARVRQSGSEVLIQVEDQGCGMDAEQSRRAFEPFHTTKSRGTGLGLSICARIVEMHGGTIELDSRPGSGTTVTVRLPIRQPEELAGGSA